MKVPKLVTVIVTLAGVAGLGLALGPSIYGQSGRSAYAQDVSRELTVLAGRGAELGVRITDATAGGVRVEEVEPDSAAAKAGLKADDIITDFDGERVRSARQFARLVRETAPGRAVKATITRNDQKQDVQITMSQGRDSAVIMDGDLLRDELSSHLGDLGRLRDLPYDFHFDYDFPVVMSSGRLGVTVNSLTSQLAEYFGAKDGVLVTSVTDGSPASRAGLKAGDVITSVNGTRVTSREDLLRDLRESQSEDVTIGIVRDKKKTTMHVKIEPRRPARSPRPV
jgi:serine protease Do